jgi:hypothetical protein
MDRLTQRYARAFLKMVRLVLYPAEQRDFYEEAARLCRSLIVECQRQAGRERCRYKPSMN